MLVILAVLVVATLQWLREGWSGLDVFDKRPGVTAITAAPAAAAPAVDEGKGKKSQKKASKKDAAKEKKTN